MLPSRQILTCEKVIFKLSTPIDCVREIAVLHYFDAEPILLTVAVTPTGKSKIAVHTIQRVIGSLLGVSGKGLLSLVCLKKKVMENLLMIIQCCHFPMSVPEQLLCSSDCRFPLHWKMISLITMKLC